ncbi:MAG TPA: ribonuclease R [Ruminiclostridium sp.]|nr:ribonuclease R [Acetivibrio saccincola]HAA42955.1 ribonuclease R [Ruminiclostridium sp.]NLW26634.1 ribonuclease R [Acetivibrio saccincola]PQQ68392.1 ribonuclease R [Acetivibrio saccincola]HOA97510.1 ribonuclease R [Acetivibrio saccincola]HQD28976.1 ribonuclease R [Acetivibrio saccincola]
MADRKRKIVSFMREDAYKPLLFEELVTVLDVPQEDVEKFAEVLEELESEGIIFKTKKNRYGVPERMNLSAGTFQGHERGYGFVITNNGEEDIFIPSDSVNGAMHNDIVIARINKKAVGGRRSEGEIIRIVKRANKTVVGTFESSRNFGFVIPDDKRIFGDIYIPKSEINGAVSGQKVEAKILVWPEKRRNAEGTIIEIIGDKNEPGTDILSIIRSFNLKEEFPGEVIKEAESFGQTVTDEMREGRRDIRDLRMITIDGEDAKDFDDAVSIERLPDGDFMLGVHIADVSHYVKENSHLDREALKRGNSVYLVDRVLPMLPPALSNGICSLNPKEDRLALSVMMKVNHEGTVVEHDIFESVINSNERMTYTEVYKILVEDDKNLKEKYSYLLEDLYAMEELAQVLKEKRIKRGAIDFNLDEAKIVLDEKGVPIEVKKAERTIANSIIEEFMILCNETVSEHFFWTNTPFLYRIHEEPDQEKIESFAEFVYNLGYTVKGLSKAHPKAFQELLEKVKDTKEETIISTVMLRSMQKAKYSHVNFGHFGLAAKYYSHFTAPIRRYSDLVIHRIIKEFLKGKINAKREDVLREKLPDVARICSERERVAEEAERETEVLKKVEYMKKHEGDVFEGVISGVASFGMFVELDNTVEGLVRMSSMVDDYYVYNEKQYSLIGERTRKIYRIGNAVKVQLVKSDVDARQIEFVLVEDGKEEAEKEMADTKRPKRKRKKIDEKVLRHVQGKKKKKKRRGR